jgi:hypothetical protein
VVSFDGHGSSGIYFRLQLADSSTSEMLTKRKEAQEDIAGKLEGAEPRGTCTILPAIIIARGALVSELSAKCKMTSGIHSNSLLSVRVVVGDEAGYARSIRIHYIQKQQAH